jgi:hypothetical protein
VYDGFLFNIVESKWMEWIKWFVLKSCKNY